MRINMPLLAVGVVLSMSASALHAQQVLAPQDMGPGAAAVETAASIPGENPFASTADPTVIEQGGSTPVPGRNSDAAVPAMDAASLNRMEVQAMGVAGQIPVRPHKTLPPPPPQLELAFGQNKAFGIALQHINQIVTPFRDPQVMTTSTASMSAERGVIYVSTLLDSEIGLLIYEKGGDPADAISLTLVPDTINPVSVRINVPGYQGSDGIVGGNANTDTARGWEMDQPYLELVKSSFRELALGRVPDGYGFQGIKRVPANMPNCLFGGFEIEPLQLVTGNSMQIIVSRITNRNAKPTQIDESQCESDALIGVATWPSGKLQSGQSAELYTAVRQTVDIPANQRPSVLGEQTSKPSEK